MNEKCTRCGDPISVTDEMRKAAGGSKCFLCDKCIKAVIREAATNKTPLLTK